MKTITRHDNYFLFPYFPIFLLVTACSVFFYSEMFAALNSIKLISFIAAAVFLLANQKTTHTDLKTIPMRKLMAVTGLFQISLMAHIFSLCQLTLIDLPVLQPGSVEKSAALMSSITRNLPATWAFYVLCGVSIAVHCYRKNTQGFYSDAMAPVLGNRKDDAISLFMNFFTRAYIVAFVVLGTVFCLNAVRLIATQTHTALLIGFNAPSFLLSTFFMLPLLLPIVKQTIQRCFEWRVPAWLIFFLSLMLLAAYAVAVCALFPHLQKDPTQVHHFSELVLPGEWQQHWKSFLMIYGLSWSPLVAGFIASTASGLTIRQTMTLHLCLPIAVYVIFHWHPEWFMKWQPSPLESTALSGFSLLSLTLFFFRQKSLNAIIRAKAYGRSIKNRSGHIMVRKVLFSCSVFCSLYVLTGIQLLSFILPVLLVFIVYGGIWSIFSLSMAPHLLRRES